MATKTITAHIFNQRVIEDSFKDNFYKVLLKTFDTHFTANLHDIPVETQPKADVISHFYDFFCHLRRSDGEELSLSEHYHEFYQSLNKAVSGAQKIVWNILFSFYALHDKSPELRAIRYAIEKSSKKDAINLYLNIKDTVAAAMSVNLQVTTLDDVFISPNDLAQVMLVIYKEKTVNKTYILRNIQSRCDARGICAGDLVALLLIDLMKTRENNIRLANRPKDIENLSFMNSKVKKDTMNRLKLDFPKEEDDNNPAQNQTEKSPQSPKKQTQTSETKTSAQHTTGKPSEGKAEDSPKKDARTKSSNPKGMTHSKSGHGLGNHFNRSATPEKVAASKRDAEVLAFNRDDMMRQHDYIVSEKSKAELQIINAISLVEKNNGDFNELLKYAQDIKFAMMSLNSKLKGAYELKELKAATANVGSKKQSSQPASIGEPVPLTKKQIQVYQAIDNYELRRENNELNVLAAEVLKYETPVKTVSFPRPGPNSPHRTEKKGANSPEPRQALKEMHENKAKAEDSQKKPGQTLKGGNSIDIAEALKDARSSLSSKKRK